MVLRSLFVFLATFNAAAAAGHRIHVQRNHVNLKAVKMMVYSSQSGVEPVVTRDNEMFYTGNITLGTPPQTFVTDFDTGSSDLWVLDASCLDDDCKTSVVFNKNASSSFKSDNIPEEIAYGDGSYAKGVRAFEVVSFGGIEITAQPFILVNNSNGNNEIKSIFGLSSPNEAVSGTPPFYTAFKQGTVAKPILTVFLEKSENNEFGGDITFGDYDTENCGDVYATTSKTTADWFVDLQSVTVNGKQFPTTGDALVDTGTSFIILGFDTTELIQLINSTVPLFKVSQSIYALQCSDAPNLPSLTFSITGNDHVVEGNQLAVPIEGQDALCFLGLADGSGTTILGDPFVRDRCVSNNIETGEISFAHRK